MFSQTKDTNETYQTGFSFCRLGHALEVGLWGTGVSKGSICFLFKHGHVTYQIDGDDKQNRKQEFSFCCWGHAPGVGLGAAEGSKTLASGNAMAPHRLRILVICCYSHHVGFCVRSLSCGVVHSAFSSFAIIL